MPRTVAILHYASPPVIGGVEATIAHHARGLADAGWPVRVISGSGASFDARVETCIDPLFSSTHPDVLAVKRELDRGLVSSAFDRLVDQQEAALRRALDGTDICIVHNLHTMNKNLPLTAALHRLTSPALVAWTHDLAWTNSQYRPELHAGYPWELLRQNWSGTRYVTISEPRRDELAELLGVPADTITIIPPGVDMARFFQWTEQTSQIAAKLRLLDADLLLLLPARLTRRKNIALALHVLHALRQQDARDTRLIVTGPPGPHNPANPGYLGELLNLRRSLNLVDTAHFLYELGNMTLVPEETTIANLYQMADALFFPSLQEGFGIPLLEAGLAGLPVFCSALPAFQQTGQGDVVYFDPEQDSPEGIATMIRTYFTANPRYRLRTRVRHQFRWETIIRSELIPLLEAL